MPNTLTPSAFNFSTKKRKRGGKWHERKTKLIWVEEEDWIPFWCTIVASEVSQGRIYSRKRTEERGTQGGTSVPCRYLHHKRNGTKLGVEKGALPVRTTCLFEKLIFFYIYFHFPDTNVDYRKKKRVLCNLWHETYLLVRGHEGGQTITPPS